MKRGFTLIELLGIIVILGIIAVIATPIIQKTITQNRGETYEIVSEKIIDSAKDWLAYNVDLIPVTEGEYVDINFEELKKNGLLRINVINPNTNKHFSNQSYVRVTRKDNNFTYAITAYDLVDADKVEEGAPTITLNGNQVINLQIGGFYDELGVSDKENVSIQIIKNGEEVTSVETYEKATYTIYYNLVENGKLGINIRTVIVK